MTTTVASPAGTARPRRLGTASERREWLAFLAMVGPNLVLMAIFTYWPLIYSAYLSFTRWDMLSPVKTWVGFNNYAYLLRSTEFQKILWQTLYFTLGSVGSVCLLGLMVGLLLNQRLKGRNLVRSVIYAPAMLSGAAIGLVWMYILDPRYGLLDNILGFAGLRSPNWLLDVNYAMPAVMLVYLWKNLGYAVVIYLAGLQAISPELYEAAVVDGGNAWHRLRYITLPGLSPITFFLILTNVLASFQSFDVTKVMTDGGPVGVTTTLIFYLYQEGFVAFNAGRAGVAAVILFVVLLLFTIAQVRVGENRVAYA